MAGIEKITETILADARAEAQRIIDQANAETAKEKEAANQSFEEEKAKRDASIEKELEDMRQRAESARDLTRRRMILEKKQEIIGRIVEKIRLSLHDADSSKYFDQIYKMFEKYCESESGTMHMNANDLNRLPSDFAGKIEQIAKSKGGSIEIVKEPYNIEDGFVLVYGGTEENCTFRSLIETNKAAIYDEINKTLWREG